MIGNNSLSNHLNAFKNKKEPLKDSPINSPNIISDFISGFGMLLIVIGKILIYGYSTKIIFNTDWNFWKIMCIGVMITLTLDYIHNIFHNKS